ncbi:MAG: hypothetical protein U9Q69_06465 [Nanoarchaeota archaeon]|nr:hypothetical protein [Nanoarchaeota archaeon]
MSIYKTSDPSDIIYKKKLEEKVVDDIDCLREFGEITLKELIVTKMFFGLDYIHLEMSFEDIADMLYRFNLTPQKLSISEIAGIESDAVKKISKKSQFFVNYLELVKRII